MNISQLIRQYVMEKPDFADIRTYPPDQFSGLIVLRLKQQDKFYVLKLLSDELEGRLWIVDEKHEADDQVC